MGTDGGLSPLDMSPAPETPGDVFDEAVESFNLLSAFCTELEACDIYPVSRHGSSHSAALEYLLGGFDASLAEDILQAYTFTDEQGILRIIPCEGIPYLTPADRTRAAVDAQSDRTFIRVDLHDCYQPGDHYVYQVTSRLIDGHWKITDLSLQEE